MDFIDGNNENKKNVLIILKFGYGIVYVFIVFFLMVVFMLVIDMDIMFGSWVVVDSFSFVYK